MLDCRVAKQPEGSKLGFMTSLPTISFIFRVPIKAV